MAKQLNVNLAFTADTSSAKRQLQDLQNQLTRLVSQPIASGKGITKEIQEASKAAAELKIHLQNATNIQSGTLDFSKLNQSIKQSGYTLADYGQMLKSLGPTGQQAFMSLAHSVAQSEVPIKRANATLTEMWTTLKNTARWQLSSSMMHGFMGTVQSAYGYAKDLNESLNNIRIVTGQNVEQMAQFASEANKAAKALSTTTTNYTNASLIYYQQGLDSQQVRERTDVTIKMANAAGQSAEIVSDQLTAVWNNFYDGSKSLEYYADVMTALGAATASSTDEISEGLNKFAAVAETVGLSYEYAASALATVTATTRQSADVVGTAFKTLFARIQQLKLGETLEDGTTLGKYSEALNIVGINIKDTSGQLKEMDDILDEMGSKWTTLAKDQRVALAQTVAGTRQYTQLIALMDNWDFMKENLATSYSSTGTLDEQAAIYAESWNAASKRVKAALQGIYDTLISDDAFIEVLDIIETIITYMDNLIDTVGGLSGVLTTLGAILTKVFSTQIAKSIRDIGYDIQMTTSAGRKAIQDEKSKQLDEMANMMADDTISDDVGKISKDVYLKQLKAQALLIDNQDRMNENEKQRTQLLMDQLKIYGDQAIETGKIIEKAKEKRQDARTNLMLNSINGMEHYDKAKSDKHRKMIDTIKITVEGEADAKRILSNLTKQAEKTATSSSSKIQLVEEDLKRLQQLKTKILSTNIIDKNSPEANSIDALIENLAQGTVSPEKIEDVSLRIQAVLQKAIAKAKEQAFNAGLGDEDEIDEYADSVAGVKEAIDTSAAATQSFNDSLEGVNNSITKSKRVQKDWADSFVTISNVTFTAISTLQTLSGIVDTLNNPDMSSWEKFLSIAGALSMTVPMIVTSLHAMLPAGAAAGTGLTLSLGPAAPIVLGIVAGIAALTAGLVALSNVYNRDAINAKKAAQAAEELADASQEVKQNLEDLKSSFNAYDEAVKKLDECTKGTEEWNAALQEVNNTVLKILSEHPELAKNANLFSRENGILTINSEERENVLQEAERAVGASNAAALMAAGRASQAQVKAYKTQTNRKVGSYGVGQQHATNGGMYYDQMINLGQLLTENAEELSHLTNEEYKSKVKELVEDSLSDTAKKYGKIDEQIDGIAESSLRYKDSIDDIALKTQEAANQISNASQLITEQQLGDKYSVEVKAMVGHTYDDIEKEIYDEIISSDKKNVQADSSTSISEDIWRRFNIAQGTNLIADSNQVRGNDNNRQYAYKDEKGEVQTYSIEYIASTIAASEALTKLTGSADTAQNALAHMKSVVDNEAIANGIKNWIVSGNFESMSKADRDVMFENMAGEDKELSDTEIKDYLVNAFGMSEEDLAKVFDVDTIDQVVEKWKTAWKDGETALASAGDNLTKTTKEIYDSLDLSKLNVGQKETLAASLGAAFKNAGAEGAIVISDAFKMATEEDQKGFVDALNSIEWPTTDVDELREKLFECGVSARYTDEQLQGMIDAMRTVTAETLSSFIELAHSVEEITQDIELGDVISQEDYDLLYKYNKELSIYFSTMADGTSKLIGDQLDLQQMVKNTKQNELKNIVKLYEDQIDSLSSKYKSGIQALDNIQANEKSTDQNIHAQGWIDFLKTQEYDDAQLSIWENELSGGNISSKSLEDISKAVTDVSASFQGLSNQVATSYELMQNAMNEIALGADSAEERLKLFKEGTINEDAYNYSSIAAHNEEKWEGLDPKEVDEYSKHLIDAAESSELLSDELKENNETAKEAAEDVAAYTKKMNRGIETLSDNFKGWSDVLKKSDKSSEEYSDAMNNMKQAMSDVLGVQEDFLSDDFIVQNMKDIELAANGDAEAINRLAIAASRDILINVGYESEGLKEQALALHDELTAKIPKISVGATLDSGDFYNEAQQIIKQAGMTVDQANAYFRSMGFEPEFVTEEQTVKRSIPQERTHTDYAITPGYIDIMGSKLPIPTVDRITTTTTTGYAEMDEVIQVPAMSSDGKTPQIKSLTRTNSGSMNNRSSSNPGSSKKGGGGGGSKPKKAKKVDKSEIVQRYKEIDDAIDDVTKSMDDASKAADRLYGNDRIKQMQKMNSLIQQEIKLTKQKKAEAERYLEEDKRALEKAAQEAGVGAISFDKNGNIANYTAIMTKLYNELDSAITSANADGGADESEQERIDAIQERIDILKKAIEQFDETRELIQDLETEVQDKFNEWQDNNLEILNHKLELKLEINDAELEKLEYYLDKIADDFYQMAEGAALMVGQGGQLDVYMKELADYRQQLNEIETAYKTGKISQEAYVESLKDIRSNIYDNLNAINELDKAMFEYYGETLAAGAEELSKYTDLMEHQTSVLEHYASVMDILGKTQDYERMGVILESQAKAIGDQAAVAKANYEVLEKQAKSRKEAYDAAVRDGATSAELELLEKQWWDAEQAANEAQEEMLSKTEAWAEAMKAIVENKLGGLAQDLENALTAEFGGSFDSMNAALERANSLQEEYLTTTNQVYETNKLMRTAQQEIDKTSNSVAKKRLKSFIDETEHLQDKSKLSKYELEIQQAKYDLLLAEIALEEAQNAKSTVRLQRDSEGNFGYVFTADAGAVADAQQQFEDAQNNLYNIGLEGANNYTEKYQQTLAEFYDTMTELQTQYLNGEFENEEEYQAAMESSRKYYYEKLQQYSSLYSIALTTDGRVVKDAWSTQFQDMTLNTGKWMESVDAYVEGVESAFAEWEEQMNKIEEETIGKDLDSLKDKTQGITDASKDLVDAIIKDDGVLDSLEAEYNDVLNLTGAYASLREQILGTIKDYEDLTGAIGDKVDAETSGNGSVPPSPEATQPEEEESTENTGANGPTPSIGVGTKVTVKTTAKTFASGVGMASWVPGSSFEVFQLRGDEVLIGDRNRSGVYTGWVRKTDLEGFDTGGYTGEWGPEGKLALLHQKEMVLNKGDTSKLLASMEILDKIVAAIDLYSLNAQLGGLLNSPSYVGNDDADALEQKVYIEASFPSVTEHSEIEEALNNLVNRASQFANRK